ncbi:MAG: DUF6279 family lipoprotein [Betaproteobacteria bacterium]
MRLKRNTGPLSIRWRALAAAAFGALLLAACSTVKLGYNNADTLLVFALDSYLDLDSEQSQLVRTRVQPLLAWHRTAQLPGYAQWLTDVERRIEQGRLGAEDLLALYSDATAALERLSERAAPALAALALTLTPAQIEHLERKLDSDTSKARRELARANGQESLEDRFKRNTERAETWLGPLTEAQRAQIRRTLLARPGNAAWWIEERERRQKALIALLRRVQAERPAPSVAADWLRAYFAGLATPQSAEVRAQIMEFRRGNAESIAALLDSATPEQRAHLIKRLRGYADDFTTLAAVGQRT